MPRPPAEPEHPPSAPAPPTASGDAPPVRPRIGVALLPDDLDGAMRALDDEAFQRLSEALARETQRRMPGHAPGQSTETQPASSAAPEGSTTSRRKVPVVEGLTPAKARLIRAAAMAGLKPNAIVKEFGVTITMVRAALAEP